MLGDSQSWYGRVQNISSSPHPSYNKITKIQLFTVKVLTQLPRGQSQTQYKNTGENNETPNKNPKQKKDNKNKTHLITESVNNIITVGIKY